MAPSQRFFWASVPASAMVVATSIVGQYGPG
jgi:hypothetical protein